MNRIATRHILVFLCSLALILISLPTYAQEAENLLTNPGFEDPFVEFDGTPPRLVAEGWTPYHIAAGPSDPGYQNQQPEYYPAASEATDATNRIHGGSNAQLYLTFFATHYGGVYQVVEGVNPGDTLEFSTYVYVWSTTFDDVNESREDGDVFVAVGIDPTGGTDPDSEAIVWTDEVEAYDAYTQLSVTATAESDTVSVWVWSTVGFPVMNNNIYVDDASLTVVEGGAEVTDVPAATEEATEAVETEAPVETEEPTEVVETEEATEVVETEAVETEEATEVVETEAVETEEATEVVETEAVETEEAGEDTLNLTATALVAGVTQTAEAAEIVETEAVTEEAEVDDLGLTATAIIAGVTQTAEAEENATFTFTPSSTPTATDTATSTPIPPTATDTATSTPIPPTNTLEPSPTVEVIIATTSLDTETPTNTPTPAGPTAVPTLLTDVFPYSITHIVQANEIVVEIAERYGSTVDAIIEANELDIDALIFIGQELIVPVSQPVPPTLPVSQTPIMIIVTATPLPTNIPPEMVFTDVIEYTIQRGDTLFVLADRFNTDLNLLAQMNGIVNPNSIQVGQIIIIPLTTDSVIGLTPTATNTPVPPTATHTFTPIPPTGIPTLPPPSPIYTSIPVTATNTLTPIPPSATPTNTPEPVEVLTTYVVQPGDSLYRISLLFGVPLADLIAANDLENPDRIFRGQTIIIPVPSSDGEGGVAPGDATALPPEMRPLALQGQAQPTPAATVEIRG